MSPEELQLECLKLAMDQTRREATTDLNRVAELQTWFYNRIAPPTEGKPVGVRKKAADKSGDPFA